MSFKGKHWSYGVLSHPLLNCPVPLPLSSPPPLSVGDDDKKDHYHFPAYLEAKFEDCARILPPGGKSIDYILLAPLEYQMY